MNQEQLEEHFSKTKAREYVLDQLLSFDDGMDAVAQGTELLEAWCILPSKYETKQKRRDTLAAMDIHKVVQRVFVDILMLSRPITLANMATTLGLSLGFEEAKQGITLAGEILTILCSTGFYYFDRHSAQSSYYIYPNAVLTDEQYEIASRGMYLPPMIEAPNTLRNNRDTPFQTIKGESLILGGQHNHHDFNISHDVLNRLNRIPLCLNADFVNNVEEEATFDLDTVKGIENMPVIVAKEMLRLHRRNWEMHIEQSCVVYETMYKEGNRFYIPNKVDKRGRIYSQGHHINPQGTSYKKAMLDLCNKETINIPEGYFS